MTANDQLYLIREKLYEIDEMVTRLASGVFSPPKAANKPKLTKVNVEDIRTLKRCGLSNQQIADVFDVNKSTITRTLNGIYNK